ncbi:GlcG/HbpS family heme-binding protein [Flavihumibacter solisilvae]|uniref:Glycolate utilization protein n=1 Tax=Flavihumibacter solisilvae TaxID=1349421 RepID=A0A0C1KY53_9BACT|nr:heme-binding protein [Flavihumibacter solisilvae]KIC92627.1 glycolate utilization protein [Flavihumibacter solisilvae]
MSITLHLASMVIQQAREKAEEIKIPVNIVVLDTAGYLKSFIRMDDAFLGSIDIAIQKAKTSMLFRANSETVGEFLKPEAAAYGLENTNGGLVAFPGGRPIMNGNAIIGYIGVSGGAVPQDSMIAYAGSFIK